MQSHPSGVSTDERTRAYARCLITYLFPTLPIFHYTVGTCIISCCMEYSFRYYTLAENPIA